MIACFLKKTVRFPPRGTAPFELSAANRVVFLFCLSITLFPSGVQAAAAVQSLREIWIQFSVQCHCDDSHWMENQQGSDSRKAVYCKDVFSSWFIPTRELSSVLWLFNPVCDHAKRVCWRWMLKPETGNRYGLDKESLLTDVILEAGNWLNDHIDTLQQM